MFSGAVMAALAAAQAAAQQPLNLTCFGGGTANKYSIANGGGTTQINGMVGTTPVSGTAQTSTSVMIPRQEGFADQTDVRLFGGDDRIRLPGSMLPGLHGGDAGWFKLKDVVADARAIDGKALVNFLNHPSVHIDRVTGTISISGKSGHYEGQCEPADPNAPARF